MKLNDLTILEVCPYSAGICGVFSRVLTEATAFKEMGHKVIIFSSNATKGSKDIAPENDELNGIRIRRIKFRKLGGESFMNWDSKWIKEAADLNPDIIITHNYRHLHTTDCLEIKKELVKRSKFCPVVLVTHAPFVKDNATRGFLAKMAVKFYDKFIGPSTLYQFDAVINICNWEVPYLLKLGIDKNKIHYIPNVIPNIYFSSPAVPPINNTALFLGRVAPVKNIEFIYELAKIMPNFNFSVVGPIEESYIAALSKKYPVAPANITYYGAVYDALKKINVYDLHKYFILPSIREAMPQAPMEAMARGRIVISSNTDGAREIILQGQTGFICENNSPEEARDYIRLSEKIPLDQNKIKESIFKEYSTNKLKEKYAHLFEGLLK